MEKKKRTGKKKSARVSASTGRKRAAPSLHARQRTRASETETLRSGDRERAPSAPTAPLHVVGIGSSRRAIEPLSELLHELPADTQMAFVIQHPELTEGTALPEILGRATAMPVHPVEDDTRLERNQVYVLPPSREMELRQGTLQIAPRKPGPTPRRPMDDFLHSLATGELEQPIGVVLSDGNGDGSAGLAALRAAGGITFALDAPGEPSDVASNAIAAGCVDFVLPARRIAREIGRISRHPLVATTGPARESRAPVISLVEILETVRGATGVDFSQYKRSAIQRRVARRVILHELKSLEDYLLYLQAMPGEVEALHQDILINATSLFRDPDGFAALQDEVFPRLCRDRGRDDVVRIWAVGCSTGEEAYSLAIAFTEYLELAGAAIAFQVFGTDIDGAAIDRARAGFFPRAIAQDMSPERLQRFFTEVDGGYRIGRSIREKCLFARHDALADPPFSRIDLVACRNVLSDLARAAQKTLLSVLHYALRDPGYLWLGSTDAALGRSRLFVLQDSQHRIHSKLVTPSAPVWSAAQLGLDRAIGVHLGQRRETDRILLARYAPAGVVVKRDLEIRQFRGDTSAYLAPAVGKARVDVLARDGLQGAVVRAIERAWSENALTQERLTLQSADGPREIDVVALPMQSGEPGDLLVLFEEQAHRFRADAQLRALALTRDPASEELPQLRAELAATRDRLQAVIEEQEIVNEELLSATEEVQSGNQELQSINSELTASKKALQASNEELASVNYELQQRNLDLAESNGDLTNLFASVQMPIVILDRDLRVRRYTPVAERVLELSAGDIGRRIGDVELEVQVPDLEALLLDALRSTRTQECEVQDRSGHSYLLRVRPYRTLPGEVQGVVLVFVDTDALKRNESVLRESESRFERIADSAPVLIWVNDLQRCRFVNRAYQEFAGISGKELSGFEWAQLVHPADREDYVNAYTQAFAQRAAFEHKFRFRRADGEYRWMMSIAQPRFLGQGEFIGYVGCTYDITEMQRAQSAWQEIDRRKNEFLATLGHELRNPLAAVKNAAYLLARAKGDAHVTERACEVIERQSKNMVRLVDDLLDVSRLTHDKIQLQLGPVDVGAVLQQALVATEPERTAARQQLIVALPEGPLPAHGDATRLDQVFTNLLNNASKFTPSGGHIALAAERTAEQIVVRVRDDGVGIEPALLSRIFDLFVQGERQAGTQVGIGLGLTLAKRLVERHGGTIEAVSAGRDQGSEFIVRLPRARTGRPMARPSSGAKGAIDEVAADRQRILVVDDDIDSGHTLAELLRAHAYPVSVAHGGTEALDKVKEVRPDVILLDIGLPDIDGYEVAHQLRLDPTTADTTIVAVTGYGQKEDVEKSRRAGFDRHMTKPILLDALLDVISAAPHARGPTSGTREEDGSAAGVPEPSAL